MLAARPIRTGIERTVDAHRIRRSRPRVRRGRPRARCHPRSGRRPRPRRRCCGGPGGPRRLRARSPAPARSLRQRRRTDEQGACGANSQKPDHRHSPRTCG
jgi:hypothetical protein